MFCLTKIGKKLALGAALLLLLLAALAVRLLRPDAADGGLLQVNGRIEGDLVNMNEMVERRFNGDEVKVEVLRAGKRLIVTSVLVQHVSTAGKTSDCAVMQQTVMPVPKTYD